MTGMTENLHRQTSTEGFYFSFLLKTATPTKTASLEVFTYTYTHTLFMSSGHMSSPVLQSFLEAVTMINLTCSKLFKILVNLVADVIQSLVKKLTRVNMCGQALETSKAKRG